MSNTYIVQEKDHSQLVQEISDAARSEETVPLVVKHIGTQVVKHSVEIEGIEAPADEYQTEVIPDDKAAIMNIVFRPIHTATGKLREKFEDEDVGRPITIAYGKCKIAGEEKESNSRLAIPVDTAYPIDLDVLDDSDFLNPPH